MIKWQPFLYNKNTYDLSHLHPFQMTITQDASNKKPERKYLIQVFFSLHCFTSSIKGHENIDADLLYKDNREVRLFDFKRYELSKLLNKIIREIALKKCFHTGHGNYFIVEVVNETQESIRYEIYFTLSKGKKKLNLFIQSAYSRDSTHKSSQKKCKPIKFTVLAFNTQANRKITIQK
jgi:hypothetical protein